MSSKTKIREIRTADINEVISFHNDSTGDKRTPEHWIWEYKSNYPDLSVFTVVEDEGCIGGTQGMIPIYINVKGKRYLSGKSENSLLNPKYRGRTLFQELYEFAMSLSKAKNMHCVWGYTPAVKVWRNKLGFSVYENVMYESILILNLRNALSAILKSRQTVARKIKLSLLTLFSYLYSLIFRLSLGSQRQSSKMEFSIEPRLRRPDDLNRLYGRLREKYPDLIHIDQDEKYIMWRIYNNPNIKYKTYFIYEGNSLSGYCYVSTNDKKRAFLTDFTFESVTAGTFLLRVLLSKLRHEEISHLYFSGNVRNPLMVTTFDLLKRFGFLKRVIPTAFVLKNISYKDEDHLYDIKNWYAGGLCTEGYSQ